MFKKISFVYLLEKIQWYVHIFCTEIREHFLWKSTHEGAQTTCKTYELSFLSVFWITSKSNQNYMLDVVNEIFYRSGSPKTRHREASWLLNSFIICKTGLYIWDQWGEVHKMTK